MEKVTSSLQISNKFIFLTPTVRRFTTWNVLFFLILLFAINVMFIFIAVFILHSGIDKQLNHEIEKIIATLEIQGREIKIIDYSELDEPDFNSISDASLFLQIYNVDNQILISSNNLNEYQPIPLEFDINSHDFTFRDMNVGEDRLRIGYIPLYNEVGDQIAILQLATFENELLSIRNRMIVFNLFLLPVLIIIVVIVSIIIAKKSFKPVSTIIETAENISAKNLNARIEYETKPGDELGRLRDTLNGLFDRIKSYINQLSQFTDHASHQMMNPLTAVKTELEYILRNERTNNEYKEALNKLLIQTDQMIKIVRTLLIISKHEKGEKDSQQLFNVSKLIEDKIQTEFEKFDVQYSIDEEIYLSGDSENFLIALYNVIDNALKYSDGEIVKLELTTKGKSAVISISDFGIGIPDSDKEKIFHRFYRTERSETLGMKGFGLGLSLVQSIIETAGGRIFISDNLPRGTVVTIEIPFVKLT